MKRAERSTPPSAARQPRSVVTAVFRSLVLLYRAATAHRSPACRFVPSCSQYALEAFDMHGARRGLPLVLRRLVRCRPGGPFGFDPVPEPKPAAAHMMGVQPATNVPNGDQK